MPHQLKRPRILRPRTAGRHCVAQPPTRPPVQRPHLPMQLQGGPDQRTPPTCDAMHRLHVPMPLSRLLPRTHAAPAHPARRDDPNTHVPACTHYLLFSTILERQAREWVLISKAPGGPALIQSTGVPKVFRRIARKSFFSNKKRRLKLSRLFETNHFHPV